MLNQIRQNAKGRLAPELLRRAANLLLRVWRAVDAVRLEWYRAKRLEVVLREGQSRPIFLFLAPEAGLTRFYMGHVILARFVAEQAATRPLLLSCDGILPICSVKSAMRMDPTRPGDIDNVACSSCLMARRRVGRENSLADISIEQYVKSGERDLVDALIEREGETPWRLVYDGIEIGKACLGETLRSRRKASEHHLDESDKALVRAFLFSSLVMHIAMRGLQQQFVIKHVFYCGDYAFNVPPLVLSKRARTPITLISYLYNGDIDFQYIGLYPGMIVSSAASLASRWDAASSRALPSALIGRIFEGTLYRWHNQGGASVFSPQYNAGQVDLHAALNLRTDCKTIVAYTSSLDEWVCLTRFSEVLGFPLDGLNTPFSTQDEWLDAVIQWCEANNDVQLIVRLHPRMGHNFRFAGASDQVARLRKRLENLPRNVRVVWPESSLSSYDLAELADVVLVSWSSIGVELAKFGVPVLGAFPNLGGFPRSGVVGFATTPSAYFAKLRAVLGQPLTLDYLRNAYRWTHALYWSFVVDVSDIVPTSDCDVMPSYRTPRNSDVLRSVLIDQANIVDLNTKRLPLNSSAATEEADTHVSQVRMLVHFLATGEQPIGEPSFKLRNGNCDREAVRGDYLAMLGSQVIEYRTGEVVVRRRSPLISRLAGMLAVVENGETAARV